MKESKILFSQRIGATKAKGNDVQLKGHMRLVFADVLTGKPKEIIEKDNLITQAVADIFAKNWCGMSEYKRILPIKNLFGGCLIFQNSLAENANSYNPPNDLTSPLVAHAGNLMNDTASKLRGNPVFSDFVETPTSIKQVWTWDATHGNGDGGTSATWGAVALCGGTLGNMGLKPFDDAFNPMSVIGDYKVSYDGTGSAWNETKAQEFPWSISDDGQTAKAIWIEGTTFKEKTMRHDYLKYGIMRDALTWQLVSTRQATIRTFTDDKSFGFEDDDYYYVATVTDATHISIDRISKEDMSVSQQNCVFSDISLYTGSVYKGEALKPFAFEYPYLYFPNSTCDHFYRLNIADNSDKDLLDGTLIIDTGRLDSYSTYNSRHLGNQVMTPIVISSGLILGHNYLINGNREFAIDCVHQIGCENDNFVRLTWLDAIRKGAGVYGNHFQGYGTRNSGQSSVLCEMYLATVNNLAEPKIKSTSLTARVEYTLTET